MCQMCWSAIWILRLASTKIEIKIWMKWFLSQYSIDKNWKKTLNGPHMRGSLMDFCNLKVHSPHIKSPKNDVNKMDRTKILFGLWFVHCCRVFIFLGARWWLAPDFFEYRTHNTHWQSRKLKVKFESADNILAIWPNMDLMSAITKCFAVHSLFFRFPSEYIDYIQHGKVSVYICFWVFIFVVSFHSALLIALIFSFMAQILPAFECHHLNEFELNILNGVQSPVQKKKSPSFGSLKISSNVNTWKTSTFDTCVSFDWVSVSRHVI